MDILSLTLCASAISQYSSPCITMLINNCRQRNPSQTTKGSHSAILLWQGVYFRSFQPNLIVHMLPWRLLTSQNLGTVNTGCQQCVQIQIGDIRWFYLCKSSFFVVGPTLIATCQDISFIFNAQYDCEGGQCGHTVSNTGIQTVVGAGRKLIHSTYGKYLINTHALHNVWRLHEIPPRNLTEPVPYVTGLEDFHHQMARKLQKRNLLKRAKAKERVNGVRAQKKQAIESEQKPRNEQSGDETQHEVFVL